uniref:RNA-binding protein 42 n=1 Tax=Romanomermis culicivorax TaxID=13658 RepID=A0A915I4F1_ROMCU
MVKEDPPENFTIRDLNLFWNFFFVELLELLDVNLLPNSSIEDAENFLKGTVSSCPIFHVLPRFVRHLKDDWLSETSQSTKYQPNGYLCTYGIEILSMQQVLKYLYENFEPIFDPFTIHEVASWSVEDWDRLLTKVKGQLVVNPSKSLGKRLLATRQRPSTIRVDQVDRAILNDYSRPYQSYYPTLIHFGVRPSVLTYTGNPEYQQAWKHFVKFRHLLSMKSKLTPDDKMKLAQKEQNLLSLKAKTYLFCQFFCSLVFVVFRCRNMKRDVTVEISSEGFYRTGLYPDVVQHGLMMLVMFCHIRFHYSLEVFEKDRIKYKFKNKALLELAFTHPSYLSNYGTNPDHARNVLSNCGIRQPEYGDIKSKQVFSRKRGINTLIDIMSRFGSDKVKQSLVQNNERLEYLGDAVVEFLSTIHLFFMFPDLEEGGLATYRSSIVQNKHLAVLGRKIGLEDYMLYAHGPDLCHEANLRHAIANAFEAVMGAIFLDGGIDVADRIFGNILFKLDEEPDTNYVWFNLPKHALQQQEPDGDRHWVEQVEALRNLEDFEKRTGVIISALNFWPGKLSSNNIMSTKRLSTLNENTKKFLYGAKHLLRSCLVKNKTQAVICDDLGITKYIIQPSVFSKSGVGDLRMKDKADLVEAFLGALYVDRGLDFCKTFCRVCLYPRLKYFIVSQKWNDPKSQLQQCCLTVRNPDGGEPDIPIYKVISIEGPTNTRIYQVAVYFKSKRLAAGCGHSVQEAEMKAAEEALIKCSHLFPHLQKQRHFMKRKFQSYDPMGYNTNRRRLSSSHRYRRPDSECDQQDYQMDDCSIGDQEKNQCKMPERRSALNLSCKNESEFGQNTNDASRNGKVEFFPIQPRNLTTDLALLLDSKMRFLDQCQDRLCQNVSLQFVPHSVHRTPVGATYAPPMLPAPGHNVPRPPFPPAISGFPPRPRLPVVPAPTSTVVIEGAPTRYNTNASAPTVGIAPAIFDEMTGQMGPAFTSSVTSTSSLPFPEMMKKTAAAATPKAAQAGTSKGPQQQAPKRYVRTAGGEIWQDPTLLEWDPRWMKNEKLNLKRWKFSDDYRVFCGDLGNEVSDELLAKAFRKYPSFQRAKVVRDKRTNKTKGYGFVSFKDPQDFIRALREMDACWFS